MSESGWGTGIQRHKIFAQCCIAYRFRKKILAIVVDQQVQMLALGEQQQLQQQVQRGQSAAVLIRLTFDTT